METTRIRINFFLDFLVGMSFSNSSIIEFSTSFDSESEFRLELFEKLSEKELPFFAVEISLDGPPLE